METKSEHSPGTNIIVLAVIWIAFMVAILSNQKVRDFVFALFGYKRPVVFENIVLISMPEGDFFKVKFHFDKKPEVYDLAVSPFSSGMFFAATDFGLFISSDSGRNWYHLDLPEEIGNRTPVYRVFFNLKEPSQMSILVFKNGAGIIYTTSDNFYSLNKIFELSPDVAKEIVGNRDISVILPAGFGQYLIGTSN